MPVLEGAQDRGRHPIPEEASSLESFFETSLIIPRFSDRLIAKFSEYKAKRLLLPVQSGFNPIDLSAEATSDMFALAIATILDDPVIGGLVLITLRHAPTILDDAVDKIAETIPKYGKPVMVCDMGATEIAQTIRLAYEKRGVPSFEVPERGARALRALSRYDIYLQEHDAVRNS